MTLFDPLTIGGLTLPNRIFMAPMTRGKATESHVPTPMMATYYRQRASAGLILSEASPIAASAAGWARTPGFWNEEQLAAWRMVTDAVHADGGRIFAQLWHMGRMVSPVLPVEPVSASATTPPGLSHTPDGKLPYRTARALEASEIPGIVADFAAAARNAMSAGFDGVQIHGSNGYLIDQFLRDGTNMRTDQYGGSHENRARLLREVTEAVCAAVGAERTAVRLSPNGDSLGVIDSDPAPLYVHVARMLSPLRLAFVELREIRPHSSMGKTDQPIVSPAFRELYSGTLVLNGDYTPALAEEAVASGKADAISFGRPYIANPDLAERIAMGAPLARPEFGTPYDQAERGYTDYPRHDAAMTETRIPA